MTDIDEFKGKLWCEVEAARQRVEAMQAETAEQLRQMQARYTSFLEVSRRVRDALRPRVVAFGETLLGATPTVSHRDFGSAGRGFHGVSVTFESPESDRYPATLKLRLGL